MSALCLPITLLGADGDSVDSGDGGDSVYDEEEASARQAEAEHRRSEHRRSDELPTLEEPCLTCILLDSELRTLRQRWHASELKIGELERLLTESRTRNEMLESRVTRFESDLAALRVTTKHVKRCLDQEDRRLGDRDGKYLTATLSDRLVQEVNNRIHFEEQAKLNKRKADFLEHCVEHRDWLEDTLASLTEFVQAFHSEDNETFKNAAECVDELAKHKSWKTCLEALRQPVARLGSAMTAKLVHRDQTELAALIEYCEEQFGPHGVCFPPDDDQSFKLAAKVNGLEADLNGLAKDYEAQAQLTRYFLTVAQQFSARAADAQNQRAQELLAGSDLLSRVFDAAFAPVRPRSCLSLLCFFLALLPFQLLLSVRSFCPFYLPCSSF